MKIELHADDLGATAAVNQGILSAWQSGALDGVSILANGDALTEAADSVNKDPERPLRIVAHLNLSEANSTSDPNTVPLLVNERGQLQLGFVGLWLQWFKCNKAEKEQFVAQIAAEWRAQIKRIETEFSPRKIEALDGHIHVHMLPFTFPVAVSLAKEFGIDQIRISHEERYFSLKDSLRIGYLINIIKHQLLRFLAASAKRHADRAGIRSPDSVAGLLYSGRMSKSAIEAAANAAERKGQKWMEVISHPGRASAGEQDRWKGQQELAGFYLSADRDFERQALLQFAATRAS